LVAEWCRTPCSTNEMQCCEGTIQFAATEVWVLAVCGGEQIWRKATKCHQHAHEETHVTNIEEENYKRLQAELEDAFLISEWSIGPYE